MVFSQQLMQVNLTEEEYWELNDFIEGLSISEGEEEDDKTIAYSIGRIENDEKTTVKGKDRVYTITESGGIGDPDIEIMELRVRDTTESNSLGLGLEESITKAGGVLLETKEGYHKYVEKMRQRVRDFTKRVKG